MANDSINSNTQGFSMEIQLMCDLITILDINVEDKVYLYVYNDVLSLILSPCTGIVRTYTFQEGIHHTNQISR